MRHKRKVNWIVYLIFGIVLTSAVTTVTLSRYMSNVSGNGTVIVASLDTDISALTFVPANLNMPGKSEVISFSIVNYTGAQVSEVDQSYSLTISTFDNLPFTYELECVNTGGKGVGINTTKSVVNTNSELIGGILNHSNRTTHDYELTVTWPSNIKDMSLSEELELIKVVIDSEQIINQ